MLKPSDGGPVAVPSQDMVLGIYYLTQERSGALGEGKAFKSVNEAILAYENGAVTLHSRIKVRVSKTMADGSVKTGTIESTLGRFIFNEIIPQDLGFVDREVEGQELLLEVDFHVGKKQLKQILEKVINTHGSTATAEVLDAVKAIGYKYSTRAAMTVSISDMTVPPQKPEMIEKAQDTVDKITKNFKRGLITEEERYKEVVETWKATDDALTEALLTGLDKYNNIFMMADSGARGSDKQIKQLAGMRGLMADTTGPVSYTHLDVYKRQDYVPMGRWKNALINLLNIAGTGPIFGPIQGILFGPIAFITIPIGCVISGATHDYLSGMMSLRQDGAQMPGIIRKFLGNKTYQVYNIFLCFLMLLVCLLYTS